MCNYSRELKNSKVREVIRRLFHKQYVGNYECFLCSSGWSIDSLEMNSFHNKITIGNAVGGYVAGTQCLSNTF